MPCKCKMKNIKVGIEVKNEIITSITKIHPFETCPYCAVKHLGYALVKLNEDNDELRYIGQVYLAYKHLEKFFKEEAKKCFELINDFFEEKIDKDKIESIVKEIHNLAINFDGEIKEENTLNLEKSLKPFFRSALYVIAAGELYNFEVGYKDVNTPYVIGLLQKAAEEHLENVSKDDINYDSFGIKFRMIWKKIENNDDQEIPFPFKNFKLNENVFYALAMRQIKIQRNELKNDQK